MIIALILVSWVGLAATDALGERVRLRQEHPSQPFLRQDGPQYRNYALRYYDNYPNHTFPYVETAFHAADLRELTSCQEATKALLGAFGRCDILINAAGATKGGIFPEQPDEEMLDGFALKFHGAFPWTGQTGTARSPATSTYPRSRSRRVALRCRPAGVPVRSIRSAPQPGQPFLRPDLFLPRDPRRC